MTEFEKAQDLLGETVEVVENEDTNSFVGTVQNVKKEIEKNEILISVLDQDGDVWDVNQEYVTSYTP